VKKLFSKFHGLPILVFGDSVLDATVRGSVDRISPEAPVPVIRAIQDTHVPGGAGNVASNLASLGARVTLVSVRGADSVGDRLVEDLKIFGVITDGFVVDETRPTVSKTRIVAGHQQVARLDRESLDRMSETILAQLEDQVRRIIPQVKAVIISDYGKGVVNRRLLSLVLKSAHRLGRIVTVDPKPEHFLYYRGVDCLTPNLKEAVDGMRALPIKNQEETVLLGQKILKRLRCRSCLITQGEKGMTLFDSRNGRKPTHIPTSAREVYDVTGAGDTVIAAFTIARAAGASLVDAAHIANAAAGVVVGKLGTATVNLKELKGMG
jgi:rfaE bifunctional protein kinase chain/domain